MYQNKRLVLAVVTDVQDSCVTYPSCETCLSKLLVDPVSQRYHCIKCGTSCHGNRVSWRYRLVLTVADNSAMGNIVVFGRTLDPVFGKTASDFHRSLADLEKSCYPAESMLMEALLHTFHGRYFYFGFKLSEISVRQSVTLKDVLKNISDESQTLSQLENDSFHTLAYQILPNSADSFESVTDHMRKAVSILKHDHTLSTTLSHRQNPSHTTGVLQFGSPRNDSVSTNINSYIDNSKQESVVFSFEESDSSCNSGTKSQIKGTFLKENQSNITYRKSGRTQKTNFDNVHKYNHFSNLNGTYSQNVFGINEELTENMGHDVTTIFTKAIIKQLEYSTVELSTTNTSSRVDRELRERVIKRKVENLCRCLLLSQHKQNRKQINVHSESGMCKNDCVNHSDTRDKTSFSENQMKITEAVKKTEGIAHFRDADKCFRSCEHDALGMSKGCTTNTSRKHDIVHEQEDSQSLIAFLESQAVEERNDSKPFEEQFKEECSIIKKKADISHKNIVSLNSSATGELHIFGIQNESAAKCTDVKNELPYSEGMETFFGTQFSCDISHFDNEENVDNKSQEAPNKFSVDNDDHKQEEMSQSDAALVHAVDFNNLPESEDLEAFLSTFDDGIKDSGLYSDNTATSVEHKEPSVDYVNKGIADVNFQMNVAAGICSTEKCNELSVMENDKGNTYDMLNPHETSEKESDNDSLERESVTDTTYLELDGFLDNITEKSGIHMDYDMTDEVHLNSPERNNNERSSVKLNFVSYTDNTHDSKVSANLSCKVEYVFMKEKNDASNKKVKHRSETSFDEFIDLEDYSKRIDSSNAAIRNSDKSTISKSLIRTPAVNKLDFSDTCEINANKNLNEQHFSETGAVLENSACSKEAKMKDEEISNPEINHSNKTSYNCNRTDLPKNRDRQEPSIEDEENGVAECEHEGQPLNDCRTSFLSDNFIWDELHESFQHFPSKLDNALISMQNNSLEVVDNSDFETDHECSDGISDCASSETNAESVCKFVVKDIEPYSQCFVPVDSSFDLFVDSPCSLSVKDKVHAVNQDILVDDSDTEENVDKTLESDKSIIMDSPTTVDGKQSRGDSMSAMFMSKMHIAAINNHKTAKNVKFHRQLRRVSSCQLMDIKMKLNTSPLRNTKVRRKSILKTVSNNINPKQSFTNDDYALQDKNTLRHGLDVLEEKSHLLMAEDILKPNTSCNNLASQDLFEDTIKISLNSDKEQTKRYSVTHSTDIINDILDKYIETRAAAKNLKTFDIIETNEILLDVPEECLSVEKKHCSKADGSGSQDLFSQVTCSGPEFKAKYISDDEEDFMRLSNTPGEIKKPKLDSVSDGETSNHVTRKQLYLRNFLLDITNTPDECRKDKSCVQLSKCLSLKSECHFIVDTPEANASQNVISSEQSRLAHISSDAANGRTVTTKEVGENFVAAKEVQMKCDTSSSRFLNLNPYYEGSPDLFADSPVAMSENVNSCLSSKLHTGLLCKKLF